MSRHAEHAMKAAGLDPVYVPHGVDTQRFRPLDDRSDARRALGWPQDAFVVGMVAANKGYPSRKGFSEAIEAFARFQRRHSDALLYLHTDPHGVARGVNLPALLQAHGVPSSAVRFIDPYALLVGRVAPEQMRMSYGAMDVLLNTSWGEGFGIPIIEAQSCGTPVIVTDWTAMSELAGAGWQVGGDRIFTDQLSSQRIPSVEEIDRALEQAYTMAHRMRCLARDFALAYDADAVTERYWVPALAEIETRLLGDDPVEVPTPELVG
jgi:glycosyltransferase involved in cell wall biosynthesis